MEVFCQWYVRLSVFGSTNRTTMFPVLQCPSFDSYEGKKMSSPLRLNSDTRSLKIATVMFLFLSDDVF